MSDHSWFFQWHMKRYKHSYLRTYRKRSGLTQRDLGLLLGFVDGAEVGRYERFVRLPNAQSMLACQAIFDTDVRLLFPDMYDEVEQLIAHRALKLRETLPLERRLQHKRQILIGIVERRGQRANHS
jgi:transcriptional regulator with XRE-family HTH domain